MKEINIAKNLVALRRAKRITQDELAKHMGVSKASVSKWETGQSYPDIALLPRLASYFNVSLDDLMDYSPQMSTQCIRELYHRLAADFSTKPYEDVFAECQTLTKRYYSCFPLLLQMVILFINHHMLASDPESRSTTLHEALLLCQRIQSESKDVGLAKEALSFEVFCLLTLQEPQQALDLLGETVPYDKPDRPLIIQAHQMLGHIDQAKEINQIDAYLNLMAFFSSELRYIGLYLDDLGRAEIAFKRLLALTEVYELENLCPHSVIALYTLGAQLFLAQDEKDSALKYLNKYVDVCVSGFFPFTIHGDSHFDLIDDWVSELTLGSAPPRSESVIKQSMLHDVLLSPAFSPLTEEPVYQKLLQKLRDFTGEE
jgi:transcriptional regulator with XRE-family HTH domain